MNYFEAAPAADLAHAVERYWFIEGPGDAVQRVFPDGHAELAIHLGNGVQGQSKCLLIGQMKQWVDLMPIGTLRVFGVQLKPEAAMAVAPVQEQIIDLSAEWKGATSWREQLANTRSIASMVEIANSFLRSKLQEWEPDQRVKAAVKFLSKGSWSIDQTGEHVALSRRVGTSVLKKHRDGTEDICPNCTFSKGTAIGANLSFMDLDANCPGVRLL